MAHERLSRLQRRILAWLAAEDQRTRGTMAASHQDLVHAGGGDKGNVSTLLKGLEAQGIDPDSSNVRRSCRSRGPDRRGAKPRRLAGGQL